MWLAMVGRERIEEIIDPELTIERALDTYAQKGYSPEWINQRLPNHPRPKRTDRCMEGARRERGAGVCHSDGRGDEGMVWYEHTAI